MHTKTSRLLAAAMIASFCLIAWASDARRAASAKTKWEYKIVYSSSEDELNKLGADGWEMVTAYTLSTDGTSRAPYCVLKRAK